MEKEILIQLVQQAKNGDAEAMGALFEAYKDIAYSIAMRETKSCPLSDDIVQETFIEAIQKIGDLQTPEAFPAWLKAITYHQCTRYYKKKETVHESLVSEHEDGFSVFDLQEEQNASFLPDEALDQKEFRATILTMIDDLPDVQRSALQMFYFEELPLKVIAQVQGVSINTANTRLNRGRKAMKGSIEDYEKKHGIRLHSIAFFPFFKWLLSGTEETMSASSATTVAQNVSAATGVAIAAPEAAVAAGVTATTLTTAATAATASAGIGAKLVAIPLALKVFSGTLVAAIALSVPAVMLQNQEPSPTPTEVTLEVTEATEVVSQQPTEDDTNYELIDLFQPLDYVCYVEESQSFVIRQIDDFQHEYDNGWKITNIGKWNDDALYVLRAGDSENKDLCYFCVDEDSFDGVNVTVKVDLTEERINQYKELGVKPTATSKELAVVRGEYVKDISDMAPLSPEDVDKFTSQGKVFFWSNPKDNASEKNHLELAEESDWSSATNTTGCAVYYHANLIKTDRGEFITERYGTTPKKSQYIGSDEGFLSLDAYIEAYGTRWGYGVELFSDTQTPLVEATTEENSTEVCDHNWGSWGATKAATTGAQGEETRTCKTCGKTETRKTDKLPAETEHQHDYSSKVTKPTCTSKGYTTYTCACGHSYKGKETAATGHSWGGWVETKAATTSAQGEETRTCKTCGKTETRKTDKLPGGNSGSSSNYVGPADPRTGISWDGVSPIIYIYADGSTGTTPVLGAKYERKPGIYATVTEYDLGLGSVEDFLGGGGSVDGVHYCEHCGKVSGDGSNGTCARWLTGGDHTCEHCGTVVPGWVCHTCD